MKSQAAIISEYMSGIGKKGGRKSKRRLPQETARQMVKVREAKRAYKKYYAQCFWSFDPHLKVTIEDIPWVSEQLLKHGNRHCWEIGRKLCQ